MRCLNLLFLLFHQHFNFLLMAFGEDLTIQNGTDAPPGKYPFFVGLNVRGYGLICGGTLIHRNVVLTAAHCRNFGYGRLPLLMFTVELQGTHYAVQSARTHPLFQAEHPELGADLMLLYFENDNATHTPLVELNTDEAVPSAGTPVSFCGKGLVSPSWSARPACLQEVMDLQVTPCSKEPGFENESLCTKPGKSRANVCDFDSGSPLLLERNNVQIGLTSVGEMDASGLCASGYVAFTSVALYFDWIQEQLPGLKDTANMVLRETGGSLRPTRKDSHYM
jgi:hypothetical protein